MPVARYTTGEIGWIAPTLYRDHYCTDLLSLLLGIAVTGQGGGGLLPSPATSVAGGSKTCFRNQGLASHGGLRKGIVQVDSPSLAHEYMCWLLWILAVDRLL